MRLLVLGGSGMLGHKVAQVLSREHEVCTTFMHNPDRTALSIEQAKEVIYPVDVKDMVSVENAIDRAEPSVVINCIGAIKQLAAGKDPTTCITVNSLFPHQLEAICRERGIRLVCISTDCVFSGRKGKYAESDVSDAEDLYGRTKFLGEVTGPSALTLRTSIIGRELSGAHGLVEWFLSQEGKGVTGFRRAIFSGLTTLELSRVIGRILTEFPQLSGLYQVAAVSINKYDLLCMIRDVYGLRIDIELDEKFVCDRSLNGTRFKETTGIVALPWQEMIQAMHDDPTPYNEIRNQLAGGD